MSAVRNARTGWKWEDSIPVTQVTAAGDFLWLAGQTAMDSEGRVVGVGDFEEQVRQAFRNIRETLEVSGSGMTSIVHLTIYFAVQLDEEVSRTYWAVRSEFFGDDAPSSTGVQVMGLLQPDMMVEIEAIAYRGDNSKHV